MSKPDFVVVFRLDRLVVSLSAPPEWSPMRVLLLASRALLRAVAATAFWSFPWAVATGAAFHWIVPSEKAALPDTFRFAFSLEAVGSLLMLSIFGWCLVSLTIDRYRDRSDGATW